MSADLYTRYHDASEAMRSARADEVLEWLREHPDTLTRVFGTGAELLVQSGRRAELVDVALLASTAQTLEELRDVLWARLHHRDQTS